MASTRPAAPGLDASDALTADGACLLSVTPDTKRKPLRATVRMTRCSFPLSPTAFLAALMRLVSVDSDTIRPPPHRRNEVVLAHHAVTVADQVRQQVKDLRFDRHKHGATPQLTAVGVERVIGEPKGHGISPEDR